MIEKPEEKVENEDAAAKKAETTKPKKMPKEIGGPSGPEPTRYGDWERNGIASDF